jgi:lipoate-protein ligase A
VTFEKLALSSLFLNLSFVTCTTMRRTLASFAASTASNHSRSIKLPVCWLDLRGAGLSVLERLCLEECLLQHDKRYWVLSGHHDATHHRYLSHLLPPQYVQESTDANPSAIIVMGNGGKAEKLLDVDLVRKDGVLTMERFSGGGTLVLDHDSIWTTIIGGRGGDETSSGTTSSSQHDDMNPPKQPRAIMKWSADTLFAPLFEHLGEMTSPGKKRDSNLQQTMVVDNKSCCGLGSTADTISIPKRESLRVQEGDNVFAFKEHDYVLSDRKMGGNAQAITSQGWLHHTSFLWDFQDFNMEYLQLPSKQPEYRQSREHNDFLVSLAKTFPNLQKRDFYAALRHVCEDTYDLQPVALAEAMEVMDQHGGMKGWLEQTSRNRIIQDI